MPRDAIVRLGLFGSGAAATGHASALRSIEGAELVAVCGPDSEGVGRLAARFGVPFATADPRALLDHPTIDAVLVDAPDAQHCELVLQAAAAGKHVLCEKPLAPTVEECAQMVDAISNAGVVGMVDFSNRRLPWIEEAKTALSAGAIGPLYHMHVQYLSLSHLGDAPTRPWRADRTQTPMGVLADFGSHAVDLVRYLGGDVAEVCADLGSMVDTELAYDDAVLLIRLANGAHGSLAFSRLASIDQTDFPGRRHIVMSGRDGSVEVLNRTVHIVPADGAPATVTPDPGGYADVMAFITDSLRPNLAAFIDAVRSGSAPDPTLTDGLRCQEILQAALESASDRSWKRVGRLS